MFCILTDFFFFQRVEKYPAAYFIYTFKHIKPNMPNKCFSVSFLFHLLLKVITCGKQKNILVCFSEMDVNVRKNREEYTIFHVFCWKHLRFYSFFCRIV